STNSTEFYLGLLYTMEGVAVCGYVTASKMKIIHVLSPSDTAVKNAEVVHVSLLNTLFSNAV
ncbi:hypothetical protein BJ322DRAFT_995297, partial [Thelephora terrestris]